MGPGRFQANFSTVGCIDGARSEKLLLAAILFRAVRDVNQYSQSSCHLDREIANQARQWILSDSEEPMYFTSFRNICTVLNLQFKEVRKKVLGLPAADVGKKTLKPRLR